MEKYFNSSEKTITYDEPYRPQLHFTPESQWMNDPNGMVYYEGEYHLFYQYHPFGKQWGPMHWGHAVSENMLEWKHLPIALEPDHLGMIFSGSAVVDWHDTSGFFDGGHGLVAMYTSADEDFQQQSVAYSKDRGRTWHKYDGNPVIANPGIKDFRDPKVIWHEPTSLWVMVLAAGQEVMFYTSKNLIDWEFASTFGEGAGAHGGVWECPDLLELPVKNSDEKKWVLQVDIGDGAIAGGSGGQYFIGHFDGKNFTNESTSTQWIDYGKDYYATQSFSDMPTEDGRTVWLAWMSNWQYANDVPTDPWRSAMSLPREVSLKKEVSTGEVILLQQPVKELQHLVEAVFLDETLSINNNKRQVCRQPSEPFILDLELPMEKEAKTTISFFENEKESCDMEINMSECIVSIDRREMANSQFQAEFPAKTVSPFNGHKDTVKLTIIVDRGSIEVFINDGEQTMTNLVLPLQEEMTSFISASSTSETIEVKWKGHILKSAWT
ncbi:glycoside hydrolase family 32 protein [Salipaludibacillus daqingensis]|uniref:glycoside hydrolase family 32 protein n=1 Tax=Salipaludibacillus daqingensis TaxID=3041001 RepID=UPI0024748CEF|nr:glycoside hydrolase family 32 protein [Salipaludibacillus daqingensis]